MNTTTVTIGDGNVFKGPVVVASNLEQSFNAAATADADALQADLQRLVSAVAALCEQLEPSVAENASRRLKSFVDEAVAKTPDRGFLTVTAKGLLDAANTVSEMAKPVIDAVTAVLAIFGSALPT